MPVVRQLSESNGRQFHHPLLEPLRTTFAFECDILALLLAASVDMTSWNYLPALLKVENFTKNPKTKRNMIINLSIHGNISVPFFLFPPTRHGRHGKRKINETQAKLEAWQRILGAREVHRLGLFKTTQLPQVPPASLRFHSISK